MSIVWAKLFPLRIKLKNYIHRLLSQSFQVQVMQQFNIFLKTSNIEGDYLEFGVFRGKTFVSAFHSLKNLNSARMKFYAFDSFEGLPPLKGSDSDYEAFKEGQFAYGLNDFKANLNSHGVDLSRCSFVPGWFDESLNDKTKSTLPVSKAAVIYIDCDLYESTVPVLDFITGYLQTGTIIAFDDWFCFAGAPDHGEQRAVAEWLDKNKHISLTEYTNMGNAGKAFIVYVKPNNR